MSQSRELPESFVRHGDQLDQFLQNFWQRQVDAAENEPPPYGRHPPLPLARIKKVMKSDPDVRMIASDAPVLFCKACEIFIQEITCRAFLVADAHKRRTISKQDIAKALAKSDHFDFLIDVVPRDELERAKTQKLINSTIEAAEAAEQVAAATASGSQLANPPVRPVAHPLQQNSTPLSRQVRQALGSPHHPAYQPTAQMNMHHNMHGHQVHPHQHQGQHQQRPHSSMMQQHERNTSGSSGGAGVHPPALSLAMAPGGAAGPGHGRPHSLSASQSHPPPLIPNANLRSPTTGTHPHSFGQGHPQLHGSQGQQQHQHQQQQQNGGNRRSSVSSRMSLSPTIPLSTSRMEPPSSLDIGR